MKKERLNEIALALIQRKFTLSVAESCTGGLLGAALTTLAGASDYFLGGIIAYDNEVKETLLGVSSETLEANGAVSEETAQAMALGAKKRLNTTHALAVTGIAGPDSDGSSKPVGLVYIALAQPEGVQVKACQFHGDRQFIREESVNAACELLWEHLKNNEHN